MKATNMTFFNMWKQKKSQVFVLSCKNDVEKGTIFGMFMVTKGNFITIKIFPGGNKGTEGNCTLPVTFLWRGP